MLDVCRDLGVETNPIALDGLGIIPLLSWYHEVICSITYLELIIYGFSIVMHKITLT